MSVLRQVLSWVAVLLVVVACRPVAPGAAGTGLSMRFEAPGEACVAQGFVGWGVEVTSLATGETTTTFVEPFAWAIAGEEVGLDGEAYLFGDYWHGLTAPGDYHVAAYGVLDAALTPAPFMTGDEAVVTVVAGATTEVALIVRCDVMPGALDVIVLVEEAPVLLDFDIDQKWVAVCQPTVLTATVSDSSGGALTVAWSIADEAGDVVLSKTETFPEGTPMPATSTFEVWLPTPGDYTGTLAISTDDGDPSVFSFPWHVRVPAIAVGACDDAGDPLLLISCDTSDGYDGLALADDPECLADAFGGGECQVAVDPATDDEGPIADFVGPWLTTWLLRGDVPADSTWQVGVKWSDAAAPVTLPLDSCSFPEDAPATWDVTVTPLATTATVRVEVSACDGAVETTIPWDGELPLDAFVLTTAATGEEGSGGVSATLDTVATGGAVHPIGATAHASLAPPNQAVSATTCSGFGLPYGFKIDRVPPIGRYRLTHHDGELISGTPAHPSDWIDITRLYAQNGDVYGFDWSSSLPIGGVKVKAQVYAIYTYDPPVTSGVRLETVQRKEISHVLFCWAPQEPEEPDVTAVRSVAGSACLSGAATWSGTVSAHGTSLAGDAWSARLHLGHTGEASTTEPSLPTCEDLHDDVCL